MAATERMSGFWLCNTGQRHSDGTTRYYDTLPNPVPADLSQLLPPPKPEPFRVTTVPRPGNVVDAKLVNYLPDARLLIAGTPLGSGIAEYQNEAIGGSRYARSYHGLTMVDT